MTPEISPEFFSLVILPLLIFTARVADVTLGTMRIIFISRGMKVIAPALAFFEILIWLVAIGQVFSNLTNVANYIAYAGGFAAGNYVGIIVEERLAVGLTLVRIITQRDSAPLVEFLRGSGYGLTVIDAQGRDGPGKIVFTLIRRKNLKDVIEAIHLYAPKAFYTIEDIRHAAEGTFPAVKPRPHLHRLVQYQKIFRYPGKGR
ncbi:MAG: DUF2179 domain-containing protein [Methanomicrobiaceae archaeon]|nr:DUF2179 domain-containing protein [Methanomicrobiaceae archaeon]MDD5418706.1 DUF2179 domain-containing protein [Methanomicrobiaceae archaeon]